MKEEEGKDTFKCYKDFVEVAFVNKICKLAIFLPIVFLEERRIANMNKHQLERLTSDAVLLAEQDAEATLDNMDQIEGVLRRPKQQPTTSEEEQQQVQRQSSSSQFSMVHTAKAERRMKEKMEREGLTSPDGGDSGEHGDEGMSPAEKRAQDAEKRAAWRKARLRSLENVREKKHALLNVREHPPLHDPVHTYLRFRMPSKRKW